MTKKAVIIGAGFGGLAAAATLAHDGYEVTVLEKFDQVGGRARVFEKHGFRFDMGPSWYLMPDVFERFFAKFDKKPQDYYSLDRLDPSYRIFFDDETVDVPAGASRAAMIFERFEQDGAKKFSAFLSKSRRQYETAIEFLYENYSSFWTLLKPKSIKAAAILPLVGSVDSYVSKFMDSRKSKQLLEYTMVFLGASPYNAPALYNILAHADFNLGVWYPQGGLHGVAQGMQKLCEEFGVRFVFESPVDEILVKQNISVGVRVGKKHYRADVVISNADYSYTEQSLLAKEHRQYSQKYWDSRVLAPSALLIYLGIDKKLSSLEHHNLYFSDQWDEHFAQIFDDPQWPDSPSFYLCAPSKTDNTVAPKGKENVFVLVPVAAGLDDSDREAYADRILTYIEHKIGESFVEDIIYKRIFSHREFSDAYGALQGTALGLAHSFSQSVFLRPRMQSSKIKNLYFCGHSTQPGIGVPPCIISGEVVAAQVQR